MLKVLDLFSGIGGFSLGLERTGGFQTVAFCEIDAYCRAVLKKHWPEVPQYDDVRTLTAERLATDGIVVDVICGGFPCQDISFAGKGAGIDGERSGLWSEYARLIGELRPAYVIVENVAALLNRGLERVLGDLATLGLDAEWHCIPASAVGAHHRRDRLWIIAHARSEQHEGRCASVGGEVASGFSQVNRVADTQCQRQQASGAERGPDDATVRVWNERSRYVQTPPISSRGANVADTSGKGLERYWDGTERVVSEIAGPSSAGGWLSEPDVGRVAHGVPSRVDRLRALGNAVVPQIPEMIGNAILQSRACEIEG